MRRLPLLLPERVLPEIPLMLGLRYGPDGSPSIGAYFFLGGCKATAQMDLRAALLAVFVYGCDAPTQLHLARYAFQLAKPALMRLLYFFYQHSPTRNTHTAVRAA